MCVVANMATVSIRGSSGHNEQTRAKAACLSNDVNDIGVRDPISLYVGPGSCPSRAPPGGGRREPFEGVERLIFGSATDTINQPSCKGSKWAANVCTQKELATGFISLCVVF